jgi:hypothetical protein
LVQRHAWQKILAFADAPAFLELDADDPVAATIASAIA